MPPEEDDAPTTPAFPAGPSPAQSNIMIKRMNAYFCLQTQKDTMPSREAILLDLRPPQPAVLLPAPAKAVAQQPIGAFP